MQRRSCSVIIRRRASFCSRTPAIFRRSGITRAEQKWTLMLESSPYSKEVADLPLGLIPGTPYSSNSGSNRDRRSPVLYTDGVTDSTDPSSGAHLDQDGLLALAHHVPFASASQAGQRLIELDRRLSGHGLRPDDDETVVVLERAIAHLTAFFAFGILTRNKSRPALISRRFRRDVS